MQLEVVPEIGFFPLFGPIGATIKVGNKPAIVLIVAIMAPKLPPLKSLRLFATVVRCGSFKLAAQELNLTPGAVSHGIKSLEEWLNVELFDRTRELVLTPAGRHYLPYINEAMSKIARGTGEILANNRDSHDTPDANTPL
jgi:uncharacterized protein YunC (DUF1805 family)